ncbi:restriction endonuclease subunit S [Desulfonatronum parangueonense]
MRKQIGGRTFLSAGNHGGLENPPSCLEEDSGEDRGMNESVILSDVAVLVMGQSPPSTSYNDTGEGLPFYQGKTDFGATYPTPRIYCREPKKLAEEGDILMSVRAPVGSTNLCKSRSCIGRGIAAIRANGIDRDFLYFYLKKIEPYIDSLGSGAIFKAINKSQLAELPINDAGIPLPEQRKIAHILTTVQRSIEAQERIIQTTTELKKALMHKLFTEGLRNEPKKRTEIGPVPESWEVVELVTLLREPLRNGHSAKATTDEGGIRTLTLTAVTQRDFSVENTKVTCADPHRVRDMWLKSGDIFIERANTADYVGLAALYEGDEDFAIFPDLLIRVRVDTAKILPKILIEWLLTEPCRRYFKRNARSTTGNFPKIDQGTVEKTLVPVPSASEQAELELSFRKLDEKLRQHRGWKAANQDLFRTLLHELVTAKTRVHDIELQIPFSSR